MTRLSPRYGAVILAIAVVTAVLALHGPLGAGGDECPDPGRLLDVHAYVPEDGAVFVVVQGRARTDLANGRLVAQMPGRWEPPMLFSVTRTFGLPAGLLQPENTLPGEREPDLLDRAVLETEDGPLPVRYASERHGPLVRAIGYFMVHRGRPIESALLARLRWAPSALLSGPWPITLFVVSTHEPPTRKQIGRDRLDAWMRRAYAHYRRVCSG